MLENGEIHNQQIKAFQFNKMLDMFKNPPFSHGNNTSMGGIRTFGKRATL